MCKLSSICKCEGARDKKLERGESGEMRISVAYDVVDLKTLAALSDLSQNELFF